ncbi:MAG: hypothetical protein U0414_43080 [Polyangiaceae bacterium]
MPSDGPSPRLRSLLCSSASLALFLTACHSDDGERRPTSAVRATTASAVSAPADAAPPAPPAKKIYAPSRQGCETVAVYDEGEERGAVCTEDAPTEGLTVIDLSDTWTPRVFAKAAKAKEAPAYRAEYLKLAASPGVDLALNGIAPNLSLVAARLTDEKRRACDAKVDLAAVERIASEVDEAKRAGADDGAIAEAREEGGGFGPLKAIQSELACAGFLKGGQASGTLGGATTYALEALRRRNMIVGLGLDADTLRAVALGGEELAFRGVLRVLRERVADAGGLLEDGTAVERKDTVVGRDLDFSRFAPRVAEALPNGAPDLVDQATDAAARALGWTGPAEATAFLKAHEVKGLRVAVKLPAAPSYHSAAMDLRVEIDRGDVFYDAPGAAAAAKKSLGTVRGPTFVIYAKDGEREVALMRWATTIGGWKKERTEDGEIVVKYKESDVGDRVWQKLIAAPAWLPPESTPESDLVYEDKDGNVSLKSSLIQPGYANAYGLAMLIHDEVVVHGAKTTYADHGIRTHGSVDYRSIRSGTSHGCHRLYNQLVLRLTGFLLEHRNTIPRGKMSSGYTKTVDYKDHTIEVEVPTRGYLYELDPPVPVRVLEGNVAGPAKEVSSVIHIEQDPPKNG